MLRKIQEAFTGETEEERLRREREAALQHQREAAVLGREGGVPVYEERAGVTGPIKTGQCKFSQLLVSSLCCIFAEFAS